MACSHGVPNDPSDTRKERPPKVGTFEVRILPSFLGGLHLDKMKNVYILLSIYPYIYINIAIIIFTINITKVP